jgi:hypothetical protein
VRGGQHSYKLSRFNGLESLLATQTTQRNAIGYAKFRIRSHRAVIRGFSESGEVIEISVRKGDFREA